MKHPAPFLFKLAKRPPGVTAGTAARRHPSAGMRLRKRLTGPIRPIRPIRLMGRIGPVRLLQAAYFNFLSIHCMCPRSISSDVQCSFIGVMSASLGHVRVFHTA